MSSRLRSGVGPSVAFLFLGMTACVPTSDNNTPAGTGGNQSGNAGTMGVEGRVIVHIMSGRSFPACSAAHLASKSAKGIMMMFTFALSALLIACHWLF